MFGTNKSYFSLLQVVNVGLVPIVQVVVPILFLVMKDSTVWNMDVLHQMAHVMLVSNIGMAGLPSTFQETHENLGNSFYFFLRESAKNETAQ